MHRDRPLPAPRPVTPGLMEARAARRESTAALLAAIDRGPQVRKLADQVQEHGRRNHFLELLDVTMGRRG